MPYIIKEEFINKKGELRTTFFYGTFEIPMFGRQTEITSDINSAKRFKTKMEADRWKGFMSKRAVVVKVD
jgi:hypothetical protein